MKCYDVILDNVADEREAIDYLQGFDFSDCKIEEENISNKRFIDSYNGVDLFYDFGADYYFFAPAEQEKNNMGMKVNRNVEKYNFKLSNYLSFSRVKNDLKRQGIEYEEIENGMFHWVYFCENGKEIKFNGGSKQVVTIWVSADCGKGDLIASFSSYNQFKNWYKKEFVENNFSTTKKQIENGFFYKNVSYCGTTFKDFYLRKVKLTKNDKYEYHYYRVDRQLDGINKSSSILSFAYCVNKPNEKELIKATDEDIIDLIKLYRSADGYIYVNSYKGDITKIIGIGKNNVIFVKCNVEEVDINEKYGKYYNKFLLDFITNDCFLDDFTIKRCKENYDFIEKIIKEDNFDTLGDGIYENDQQEDFVLKTFKLGDTYIKYKVEFFDDKKPIDWVGIDAEKIGAIMYHLCLSESQFSLVEKVEKGKKYAWYKLSNKYQDINSGYTRYEVVSLDKCKNVRGDVWYIGVQVSVPNEYNGEWIRGEHFEVDRPSDLASHGIKVQPNDAMLDIERQFDKYGFSIVEDAESCAEKVFGNGGILMF